MDGDPSFLSKNLISCNIKNQQAKVDNKTQCRFYFSGMTLNLNQTPTGDQSGCGLWFETEYA